MPKLPNNNTCTGCMACGDICPKDAISFFVNKEGFYCYKIDKDKCIDCHLCDRSCHVLNNLIKKDNYPPTFFAARSKEYSNGTASGGVFTAIATQFIKNGGVVYGACIEGKVVKHKCVEELCELTSIQGTKYLQSSLNNIYKDIKQKLKAGIKVLFSGTSCQVAGLLSFVGKDNEHLYTIDLICHGVPSFLLIDAYERELKEDICVINSFRDKEDGWSSNYALTITTKRGKIVRSVSNIFNDAFKGFCTLRRSCYNCKYRSLDRISDVTLGDFWHYRGESFNDGKGLNIVIVNSKRGEILLSNSPVLCESVSKEDALRTNPNLYNNKIASFRYHPYRLLLPFLFNHCSLKWLHSHYSYKNNGMMTRCYNYLLYRNRKKCYEQENKSRNNDHF